MIKENYRIRTMVVFVFGTDYDYVSSDEYDSVIVAVALGTGGT